jgi:hypothetical protein
VAGPLTKREVPKRKSKLTPETIAAIRRLRAGGASYRTVAATVGVSQGSVRNALRPMDTAADADKFCAATGGDASLSSESDPQPRVEVEAQAEVEVEVEEAMGAEQVCAATASAGIAVVDSSVLADPVPRAGERVLAR